MMNQIISTRTKVRGKALSLVPVERIRPTNPPDANADARKIRYSPIVLVLAEDEFCYIVDGNHRFYSKLKKVSQSARTVAWIIEEGDEKRLTGNPLPRPLQDWKDGLISFQQLCSMAMLAWQSTMRKFIEEIPTRFYKDTSLSNHSIVQTMEDGKHDSEVLDRAQIILQILSNKMTLHQAARVLDVSVKDIGLWQKIFIDGGIKALKEHKDCSESKLAQISPGNFLIDKKTQDNSKLYLVPKEIVDESPDTNQSNQTKPFNEYRERREKIGGKIKFNPAKSHFKYEGKYLKLKEYLIQTCRTEIKLNFSEIEEILGSNLPLSARKFRTWWANSLNRHHSLGWMLAGYEIIDVQLGDNGHVTFRLRQIP